METMQRTLGTKIIYPTDMKNYSPFQYMQDSMDMIQDSMNRMYAKKLKMEERFADDIENGTPITIKRL